MLLAGTFHKNDMEPSFLCVRQTRNVTTFETMGKDSYQHIMLIHQRNDKVILDFGKSNVEFSERL